MIRKWKEFLEQHTFVDQVVDQDNRGDSFNMRGDIVSNLKVDDKPAGMLHYRIKDDCFHVVWLNVFATFKGLGYGDEIMKEVLNRANTSGSKSIELQVLKSNVVAVNLYKKHGFEIKSEDSNGYMVMVKYLNR